MSLMKKEMTHAFQHPKAPLRVNSPVLLEFHIWLVVYGPTLLKNMSQMGVLFPTEWKNKIHVPNHQSGYISEKTYPPRSSSQRLNFQEPELFFGP